MNDDRNGIEALLESVSEGRPVDWDAAAAGADGGELGRVQALRDVARIVEFSRSAQRVPGLSVVPGGGESEPRRWGTLLLLERLGAGATGEVWRAWDPQLEREIALKLLQPDAAGAALGDLSPLLEEGRALARVQHANVVTVHGIERHDGRVGLRMEYVRGTTLEQQIAQRGPLAPDDAARVGLELARALGAVHDAGLVHRDVKPANLVRDAQGRLVLTDFGLGLRRFLARGDGLRVTGTPMFMSPERLAGEPATERGDLYAAGVTLWCALTGKHPFEANTLGELKAAVRQGPPIGLAAQRPNVPSELASIVERAMAPDAGARFASAAELASALERFLAGPVKRPKVIAMGPWLAAAAALLVVAAAGTAWWLQSRAKAPASAPASPPAVATAPVAAEAAGAYAVEATLVRHGVGGPQRLATGDRVRPGDRLSLEFRSSRPAYVYVLNEDERGESYLLFPQPRFDRVNPVAPDSTWLLPGTIGGEENAWTVTSRGGREHFLVVASPEPVAELEAELSRLPAAKPGRPIQYAAVSAPTVERLRGVGGVTPVPASDLPRRAGTFERFEALAGRETGVRGTWVRQITLENPLR